MKIAVLTDSAANLSQEFIKQHKNLFVVPLMIVVDGKEFRDQKEMTASEIYQKLDNHEIKTSLPVLPDIKAALKAIKKAGYTHLLVINMSSSLSGTFNSFRLALEAEKELKTLQYDTKTLGGAQGFIVEYALELVKTNKPLEEILPLLEELRNKDSMSIYTMDTLKYLRRSGRIGKVEGTVGDLFRIKPIITVNEEGVFVTLSKAFGLKRSLLKMKAILIEEYGDDLIDLIIHYGNNEDLAKEMAEKIKSILNIRNLYLSVLTPVLGLHSGPNIIAYVVRRIA